MAGTSPAMTKWNHFRILEIRHTYCQPLYGSTGVVLALSFGQTAT
jgi:hypothetical protein